MGVQVLVPVRKGPVGVTEFNKQLQAEFNPPASSKSELTIGPASRINYLRVGDRVMQVCISSRIEARACTLACKFVIMCLLPWHDSLG